LLLAAHPRRWPSPGLGGDVAGLLEVEAGAEPAPRAGEDRDPAFAVVLDGVEGLVQIVDELSAHRVQPLRPIESEERDAVADGLAADGGHGSLPSAAFCARASSSGAPSRSDNGSSSGRGPR